MSETDLQVKGNEPTAPCENTSHKGLPEGWTRATFILKEDYMKKIKAQAYWQRTTVKELLEEALAHYFEGKDIEDIPVRKKLG